jgi:hypothetical protein
MRDRESLESSFVPSWQELICKLFMTAEFLFVIVV